MNRFSDITPVEIAGTAALLSDVARAAIMCALMDGRARTAGELAFAAGVTPQTASSHLARLVDAGLIAVVPQGRHRYHRLASADAAQTVEALGLLTTRLPRRARVPGPRDAALRAARTCYDHLAGHFGVAIADALRITGSTIAHDRDVEITPEGERRLAVSVWTCGGCAPIAARCAAIAWIGVSGVHTWPVRSRQRSCAAPWPPVGSND